MVQTKKCVDHIDNDKQKNNLINLRFATCKENTQSRTIRFLHTSGVKDESWYFENKEDAINIRVQKAKEEYGEYKNKCALVIIV